MTSIRTSIRAAAGLLALLLLTACANTSSPTETTSPFNELQADAPGVGVGETQPQEKETEPIVTPEIADPADAVDPASAVDPAEIIDPVETIAPVAQPADGNADFYPNGLFIYGDAVYTQAYYAETNINSFALTAQYYAQLFGSRSSVVIAPLSSMTINNEKVNSMIPDQGEIFAKMKTAFDPSVNFVDSYAKLYEHRGEYLFFRTDHHWTQLGAYYAYTAFAESMGWTPTPLSSFTHAVINDNYAGSMYDWTKNERVKSFKDQLEVYYPPKAASMTVVTQQGETLYYDGVIANNNVTYVTFIAGDNPYTYINVPDNPQDLSCLVMKDSFGNAFVPFLCEHYGNIVVVDARFVTENLYDKLYWYGFSDIIFVNNIEAANSNEWPRIYMSAVGVEIP